MYRGCGFSTLNSAHQLSDEQVACYDTLVDLRYKFNFTRLDRGGKPRSDKNPTYLQGLDYNISVPEMLLIKAECMARKGDNKCRRYWKVEKKQDHSSLSAFECP